ncbi:Kinesin light chain [Seminavis robusta]|uniref:Kinesin light chain n=1 Tax=Seminavis robusta TaxID=568900 RepID=A0A9N8DGQ2_9STRA|nr:Kinesin light chain [Seminavis robusta]|eukprot:Sro134_g063290.1 Kinesin light chain (265) ;mRNA; f:8511-9388
MFPFANHDLEDAQSPLQQESLTIRKQLEMDDTNNQLALQKDAVDTLVALGDSYSWMRQDDNYATALRHYKEAVDILEAELDDDNDDHLVDSLMSIGDLHCSCGNIDEAMSCYLRVTALSPSCWNGHVLLRIAILDFGNLEFTSALGWFKEFVELRQERGSVDDLDYFIGMLSLGVCHALEENQTQAQRCFNQALQTARENHLLELNPEYEPAVRKSRVKAKHQTKQRKFSFGKVFGMLKRSKHKEKQGTGSGMGVIEEYDNKQE